MRRLVVTVIASMFAAACAGGTDPDEPKRFPVSSDYPPGTMRHLSFSAGVPEAWRITALATPERETAPWKIVIVTGTPSWNEYWAPTLAGAAENREIIVANRPGFATSEPESAVPDIAKQADALAPMLAARPGQRVVLVGQSFGASVATVMAARHPDEVDALVLVSSYFGERGPTARRLFGVGRVLQGVLPRDLKNSISEVRGQQAQLPGVWDAFGTLKQPVLFVHGDQDSFVTIESTREVAAERGKTLIEIAGGDHFLNACCVPALLEAVERAIAEAEGQAATATRVEISAGGAPN